MRKRATKNLILRGVASVMLAVLSTAPVAVARAQQPIVHDPAVVAAQPTRAANRAPGGGPNSQQSAPPPPALQGVSRPLQPLAPPSAMTRLPVPDSEQTESRPATVSLRPAGNSSPQPIQRTSFQNGTAGASGRNPDAASGKAATGGLPAPSQLQFEAVGPVSPNAWTLEQAEATTVQFNPILRRSLARIESSRGDAQQAGLYPNPRFDTNNPEVFAGPNSSYNVGFMQDLVVKGKLRLDRAAANEVVRQKEHGLTQDRFELLKAVRQQFYTVLAEQRRTDVLGQMREIAAAAVRAAQGREDAGEGTVSEVLLLQTELARAEIALAAAQTNLAADRRQLAAIIGRPDLQIEQVAGQLRFGFPDFDENILREFVVSQNAQVQVARREIERNEILLRRARVEPYPNVRVGPTYNNNLLPTSGSQQFWFTVQFDIPTWNRNQGNIRATQADITDAIASLGVLQNDLLAQVEDVLGRYRAARLSEERIRTQVLPTATRAQQLVKEGYQKGILDISTFLQAQRALTDASLSYIDALQSVWTTAAEIATLLQLDRFP